MKRAAFLMMEVAVVLLVTIVISVFLFRGYAIFSRAQQNSLAYMKLASDARKDFWQLSLSADNSAALNIEDTDISWIKKSILNTQIDGKTRKLDSVALVAVEVDKNAPTAAQ